MRIAGIAAGFVLGAIVCAPAPAAPTRFSSCNAGGSIECARVSVPLDWHGATAGRIGLHVERVRATSGHADGVVIALAGGPGQAATLLTHSFTHVLAPGLRTRDLIVFDPRGTGRSGLLRCPALEREEARVNPRAVEARAGECASTLGPRRVFYTTNQVVDDVEGVRKAIGVNRIVLAASSYGTEVAEGYALRYPQHTESLLLDSVVPPDGPDALGLNTLHAIPRVLTELCSRGTCRHKTRNLNMDLAKLVRRLVARPFRGVVRRQRVRVGPKELLYVIVEGDEDPALRLALPNAIFSALAGKSAPLIRLYRRALVDGALGTPQEFSTAIYVATTCQGTRFTWERTLSIAGRTRAAHALLGLLPEEFFAPFNRVTVAHSDAFALCARWPATPKRFSENGGGFPNVRTLILGGDSDLRTPVEDARAFARRLSRSTLVVIPNTGHNVLADPPPACARRAIGEFFAGVEPREC